MTRDARELAAAFVECTTEYDFAEMPDDVAALLVNAAEAVLTVVKPRILIIREGEDTA